MKKRRTTQYVVYIAVFAAMSVILNSIDINMITYKITFTYIPAFLAGAFLGPIAGALAGGIGDLMGFVINPQGAINPLIFIGSVLMGALPGFVFKIPKIPAYIKIMLSFVAVFLLCTLGVNTAGIYLYYSSRSVPYLTYIGTRAIKQGPTVAANLGLAYPVYALLKKYVFRTFIQKPNPEAVRDTDSVAVPQPSVPDTEL